MHAQHIVHRNRLRPHKVALSRDARLEQSLMNQLVLLSRKYMPAERKIKPIVIDKREGKHMSLIQRAALFPSKRARADELQICRYLTTRPAVFLRGAPWLHLAVADAVSEINDKADQKPAEHNLLGKPRKRVDKIERCDDPEDRNDGNERACGTAVSSPERGAGTGRDNTARPVANSLLLAHATMRMQSGVAAVCSCRDEALQHLAGHPN